MDKKKIFRLSVVFSAVYFFSLNGLGALPNLSVNFILKEKLKLDPSHLAYYQAITMLAWVVKPLWGFISDALPIGGYKRKSYLLITSALACVSWIGLALVTTMTVKILLILISIAYLAYAFQDVVTDGLMVDVGKPLNLTGQFQSVQWCSVYAAMILTAFAGGYVSDLARAGRISYNAIFLMTAFFPLVTLVISAVCVHEEKHQGGKAPRPKVKKLFRNKPIGLIALFLFFWNFSPSFGAPFFYYSVDTLKFSGSFLGTLQAVTSAAALLGSVLFGKFMVKMPVRKFLIWMVFLGVGAILFHFVYFWPGLLRHAEVVKLVALTANFALGLLSAVIYLVLLNLAAKVCPEDAGATVFAFLMSFYNLGLMGSSALGGVLYPVLGLKMLIFISAIFSLLVLFFIPALPIEEDLSHLEKKIQKLIRLLLPERVPDLNK